MRRQHKFRLEKSDIKSLAGGAAVIASLFFCTPDLLAAGTVNETTDSSTQLFSPRPRSTGTIRNLFSNIRQYLGIPYRFGGESTSGFDCSGFVRFMFNKELDVNLPHSSREMANMGTRVERDELKPGDLVFFKNSSNNINHVGIFIGNDTFVHSSSSRGITRDTLNESYYSKRFAAAVRIVELQENPLSQDIESLLESLPEEDTAS